MQGKSASLTPEKIEAAAALLVSGHTQTKADMLPRTHTPHEEDHRIERHWRHSQQSKSTESTLASLPPPVAANVALSHA